MPRKILLADDSITIQKVVELTFSDGDYEVVAVNNGAKAIQKLSEMKPDIILSDIIMPEKNGYEVCEFVKSHPEYRRIPVILLTGTFEPFDPDRAEKAGCDAVVTKPFESQGLIHKVEELIEQSQSSSTSSSAPAAAPAAEPQPAVPQPQSPITQRFDNSPPPAAAPEPSPPSGGGFQGWPEAGSVAPAAAGAIAMGERGTESESFSTSSSQSPFEEEPMSMRTTESPFGAPDDAPSPAPGPAPAFQQHSDEIFGASTPESASSSMPFEEPAEINYSGETKAFPMMSLADLQRVAQEEARPAAPSSAPPVEPEPSPWQTEEPEPLSSVPDWSSAPASESSTPSSSMPLEPEHPSMGEAAIHQAQPDETFPFSRSRTDEGISAVPTSSSRPMEDSVFESAHDSSGASDSSPWEEQEPEPVAFEEPATEPAWSPASPAESPAPLSVPIEAALPWSPAPPLEQPSSWSPSSAAATAISAPAAGQTAAGGLTPSSDLSDQQLDRIARRVVELLSSQVIKEIAWEVIPELAEAAVRERIRELESEPS